jgi:hypothetical protein
VSPPFAAPPHQKPLTHPTHTGDGGHSKGVPQHPGTAHNPWVDTACTIATCMRQGEALCTAGRERTGLTWVLMQRARGTLDTRGARTEAAPRRARRASCQHIGAGSTSKRTLNPCHPRDTQRLGAAGHRQGASQTPCKPRTIFSCRNHSHSNSGPLRCGGGLSVCAGWAGGPLLLQSIMVLVQGFCRGFSPSCQCSQSKARPHHGWGRVVGALGVWLACPLRGLPDRCGQAVVSHAALRLPAAMCVWMIMRN